MSAPRVCSKCGSPERADDDEGLSELRPYGKGGALVCFPCGMADEATTNAEFARQLDAAGPGAVLTADGPRPLAEVIGRFVERGRAAQAAVDDLLGGVRKKGSRERARKPARKAGRRRP